VFVLGRKVVLLQACSFPLVFTPYELHTLSTPRCI